MTKEKAIERIKEAIKRIEKELATPMLERTDRTFYLGKLVGLQQALDLLEDDIKNFFEENKYKKILDDMLSDHEKNKETMTHIESMEEKRTYMFMGQAGHGKPIKR